MVEIKENMYVRTDLGEIAKIIKSVPFKNETGNYNFLKTDVDIKYALYDDLSNFHVIKASYNIIDLIEAGDIIVGKDGHKFEVYAIGRDCVYINGLKEFILIDEIKAIVTKEQFESMKYNIS